MGRREGSNKLNLSNKLALSPPFPPSILSGGRDGREKESDGVCGEMGVRKAGISPFKNKNCYPRECSRCHSICLLH